MPRKIPIKEKEGKQASKKPKRNRRLHNRHHFLTKCRVNEFLNKEERRLKRALTKEEKRQIRHKEMVLIDLHQAWNTLFAYKFPWDAIKRIKSWSDKDLKFLQKMLLDDVQIKAWDTLFGKDASPHKAIEIVRIDWTPPYPPAEKLSDEAAK